MATGAIATLKPLVGAISAPKTTTTTTAAAAAAARTTTIRGKCHLSLLLAPSYGKLPSSGSKCCCGHNSRLRRSRTSEARLRQVQCNAGEVSVSEASSTEETSAAAVEDDDAGNWLPVIPIEALPKGERRLVRQDGATVLLLWYKNDVYAIENTSPAEGAYSEGLVNARLTPDGAIVCPSTDTTFDLNTGKVKEWMPNNPVLRFLTPPLRDLLTYPVKMDSEYIYINVQGIKSGNSAEIVFGGATQAGKTASDVSVDEVRMVVDENEQGFGFTPKNELINGRAAMIGFLMIVVQELVSGKGFLKGIGFLDFLYQYVFPGYSP
ncbi:unnamed protein product [Sphagnum jensenii]|uniref:Rieske domain-containing protein n=1 Tax=Sphagnum jensenii TaxID=128206 RepID=A0ABP0WNX8_9BRYO